MQTLRTSILPAARAVLSHQLFRPIVTIALLALWFLVDHHAGIAAPLILGVLSEGQHTGEFILSEANGTLSRDTVTVTVGANTTLQAGAVLGQIAATGKYVPYDDGYSDGREDAAGLLYATVVNDTDGAVDVSAVIINKDAEVRRDDLQFEDEVDEDGAIADLLALGIKARD